MATAHLPTSHITQESTEPLLRRARSGATTITTGISNCTSPTKGRRTSSTTTVGTGPSEKSPARCRFRLPSGAFRYGFGTITTMAGSTFTCRATTNRFHRFRSDGTFREIAREMQVQTPIWSFPVWFWDYNNDGWLDLYVSSHYESVSQVLRSYLNLPTSAETHKLYQNINGKSFQDVTLQVGLNQVTMPMGANFGDVDNDGFLDFCLGTGAPSYGALVPNMLFRNVKGKRFVDITSSSGTGCLQKGHGVAIGNLFHDGQPAIYVQLGGMVPGDRYYNALYKSLGNQNNWIDVKLIGVRTNRAAIGARIKLTD